MKKAIVILLFTAISIVIASGNDSYIHFIDGGALVVFEGTVTELQIQDVLESTLYSQMLASHDNNRFDEFSYWYQGIQEYLEKIGWIIDLSQLEIVNDNSSSTYEEAIQKILQNDFDESEMKPLTESIVDLSNNHSAAARTLFTKESSKGIVHNFQMLLVKLNSDGSLIISYTGFVLITLSNSSTIQTFTSTGLGLLSNSDYAAYRDSVTKYLGGYAKTLIQEY